MYDVTSFVYGEEIPGGEPPPARTSVLPHPGGPNVLLAVAGYDTTAAFHAMHGTGRSARRAVAMMRQYQIGTVGPQHTPIHPEEEEENSARSNTHTHRPHSNFPYLYTVGSSNDVPVLVPVHDDGAGRKTNPTTDTPRVIVVSKELQSLLVPSSSASASTSSSTTASTSTSYTPDDATTTNDPQDETTTTSRIDSATPPPQPPQPQRKGLQQQQHDVARGNLLFEQLRQEIMNDPDLVEPKWRDTRKHLLRSFSFYILLLACIWDLHHSLSDNTTNESHHNHNHDEQDSLLIPGVVWTGRQYQSVVVGAVCLGLFWQQCAFVAHDACHRGTPTGTKSSSSWLGWWCGSVIFGISTSMWTDEHYVHHVATRRPHYDPQFRYYPIAVLSLKELHGEPQFPHLYPLWLLKYTGMLALQQGCGFLLFAAVFIGRLNLHLISIVYCVKHCGVYYYRKMVSSKVLRRWRGGGGNVVPNTTTLQRRHPLCHPEWDLFGMFLFWIHQIYLVSWIPLAATTTATITAESSSSLSVFFHYLAVYGPRILFVCLSNWTTGILHIQLLVSHIGVESFTQEEQQQHSWLSHQVLSSRNVTTTAYAAWYWGGLEYQIEHHLFPRLPRESLRRIAPRVQQLCTDCHLPYRTHPSTVVLRDVVHDLQAIATIAFEIPA